MIIDLILDRRDGVAFDPRAFYRELCEYGEIWPDLADPITLAIERSPEQVVKFELCRYVIDSGLDPEICDYINSVNWKQ